jgi:CheY-like chemotaxis protein
MPTIRLLTHDLNNQFQIITGFGSMLEDDLQDPEQKDNATQVMNAVNKSVDLVKELREFFPPKIKPRIFMPERLLQTATEELTPINSSIPATIACAAINETSTGILVVDDEPLVQRFLCEMLKRLKYRVLGCMDGHEAIQQLKKNPFEYNMAIVDISLPDINTEALLEQLKQYNPQLKVLLISGEDPGEGLERLLTKGANGFMQKPTTIKALGDAIVAILAK